MRKKQKFHKRKACLCLSVRTFHEGDETCLAQRISPTSKQWKCPSHKSQQTTCMDPEGGSSGIQGAASTQDFSRTLSLLMTYNSVIFYETLDSCTFRPLSLWVIRDIVKPGNCRWWCVRNGIFLLGDLICDTHSSVRWLDTTVWLLRLQR